jgi:pimeloyl-ACP methyl ester carboxylesterase
MCADRGALVARLRAANPRLTEPRARFLAEHFGVSRDDGRVELAADPWRRIRAVPPSFPTAGFFRTLFARISAPALWIRATDSRYMRGVFGAEGSYSARFNCLRRGNDAVIADAGHNVHHDQPERVAELIEAFLLEHGNPVPESFVAPAAAS